MQLTVIDPTTEVVTAQILNYKGASSPARVTFSADNLADAETIQIYVKTGATMKPATIIAADGTGVTVTLNAALPSIDLPFGPVYFATKSATTTACGLYAD